MPLASATVTQLSARRTRPVIVAVDDNGDDRARTERELRRRYGSDYRLIVEPTPEGAFDALAGLRAGGSEVALILAAQWMDGTTGSELLARARRLHPDAKRGLLIRWGAWGDRPTRAAVLRAMALGHIDYYVLKPWWSPDEQFHRTVGEFLHEFARDRAQGAKEVLVVGEPRSRRSHELRETLARNGIAHAFVEAASDDGFDVLAAHELDCERLPVVVTLGGEVLVDPADTDLAEACGASTRVERDDYDVVVIGAGPGGLAAAVSASSEGLSTLVVERRAIGGQAGASALIRNYPGFSRGVSGAELAQRSYQQAWVFGTDFLLMREVNGLEPSGDRWRVRIPRCRSVSAKAVVMACGVSYRRLGIAALDELVGAGVFYGATASEARALAGERAFVVGGGNSAGQAAKHLARYAKRVTIVVRGDSLAASMSHYLRRELEALGNVEVRTRTQIVGGGGECCLEQLVLEGADGCRECVDADALFVMIGARPQTGWLPGEVARDPWGFVFTGADAVAAAARPLERPPLPNETTARGVFALGDVRHGSTKRVASAVGEGAAVISQLHELVSPDRSLSARLG